MKPDLHTARFQCGLLYMLQDRNNDAVNTWLPLAELPKEDPLYQFATGLTYLIANDKEKALIALKKGIELNTTNLALNRDMQNVINRLSEDVAVTSSTDNSTPAANETKPGEETAEDAARKAMLIKNYGSE